LLYATCLRKKPRKVLANNPGAVWAAK